VRQGALVCAVATALAARVTLGWFAIARLAVHKPELLDDHANLAAPLYAPHPACFTPGRVLRSLTHVFQSFVYAPLYVQTGQKWMNRRGVTPTKKFDQFSIKPFANHDDNT